MNYWTDLCSVAKQRWTGQTTLVVRQRLCAFRSPHNSHNNIAYLVNHYSEDMERYFSNLGKM